MNTGSLISWLDVEFVMETRRAEASWPEWLLRYTVYQDELSLEVRPGTSFGETTGFLKEVFGERFDGKQLSLECTPENHRKMLVTIEESHNTSAAKPLTDSTSFRRMAALPEGGASIQVPKPFPPANPPLIAFYSFKGGVGRTTHLLSYLRALSLGKRSLSALVVDADLEAPGITTLLKHEHAVPKAHLSLIDVLALLQSDRSLGFETSASLSAYLVARQGLPVPGADLRQEHFFLPAFRTIEQAMRLDIRPEHVAQRPGMSWALSDFLSDIGKRLGVDAVLIDLRAGFSELSSPFLFDPRVRKVIVTTPSIQSIDGTISIVRQLAKTARSNEQQLDPVIVLSFVLPELLQSDFINKIIERIQGTYPELRDGENDEWPLIQVTTTLFTQELLYLTSMSEALERLESSPVTRKLADLIPLDVQDPTQIQKQSAASLEQVRDRLARVADELEYAESGRGEAFLRIAPLRSLARQFASVPPVAVVIGAKGSGKTYTYLQVLRAGDWSEFARIVTGDPSAKTALLCPVLESSYLDARAKSMVKQVRASTLNRLGIQDVPNSVEILDEIRTALKRKDADETWWRHKWFEIFAWSLGLPDVGFNAAAGVLVEAARRTGQNLLIVIDGLEDILPELATNPVEQIALRALIQGIPAYLREIPDNPLGILVFVRADLARAAVPQNYGQFAKLYEAFSLQWNEEEALRLAVWLARSAGLELSPEFDKEPELLSLEEAKEALVAVWGRKLGSQNSREARSAEWVMAALSDFRGQIQARDLVRFLHYAAEGSSGGTFQDRVLMPVAIRSAIRPCSIKKIEEAEQEIPQLKSIFTKLQRIPDLRIPFDASEAGLNSDEVRFLQSVGIVAEAEGEYYMPEIFRFGLGIRLSEGARPKVLSLAKRFR